MKIRAKIRSPERVDTTYATGELLRARFGSWPSEMRRDIYTEDGAECIGLQMRRNSLKVDVILGDGGNYGNIEHYEVFLERFQEWADLQDALACKGLFVSKRKNDIHEFRETKNFQEFKTWTWLD